MLPIVFLPAKLPLAICEKPDLVALAVCDDDAVELALTAAAFVVVVYMLATMLLQLDSALRTLAQPEHTVAAGAWLG